MPTVFRQFSFWVITNEGKKGVFLQCFLHCGSADSKFPQLLFVWGTLDLFIFERYFHWIQNSLLTFFSFQHFKDFTMLSFGLQVFWQEVLWFLPLFLSIWHVFFSSGCFQQFIFVSCLQQFDYYMLRCFVWFFLFTLLDVLFSFFSPLCFSLGDFCWPDLMFSDSFLCCVE